MNGLRENIVGRDDASPSKVQDTQAATMQNLLRLAFIALDNGNHAEATAYFSRVLEFDPDQFDATYGKAIATAWQSSLAVPRLAEAANGIRRAFSIAPNGSASVNREDAAAEFALAAKAFFELALNHVREFGTVDRAWGDFLQQAALVENALLFSLTLDPNPGIRKLLVGVLGQLIAGVRFCDGHSMGILRISKRSIREISVRRADHVREIQASEPSYRPPRIKDEGYCFIATAVIQSDQHWMLRHLREFRDTILLSSNAGRSLVAAYYKLGRRVGPVIAGSRTLRVLSGLLIVLPAYLAAAVSMLLTRRRRSRHAADAPLSEAELPMSASAN